MKKPRVMVTVLNQGWIHKTVVQALINIYRDQTCEKAVALPAMMPPVEQTMCVAAANFYEQEYDWWLTIDDDNPPVRNPLELIKYCKDIMGCPTPIYMNDKEPRGRWNVYKEIPGGHTHWENHRGLQRVDAIGAGCMLLSHRVFENPEMRKAPF